MNEINFEIQDIEKIDLSMDVVVKEIYPPIENLEVTPTKEQQIFAHENSYGYDNVTINPIPDEYIIPNGTLDISENGDVDVSTFKKARVGVYTPPNLQNKEITITENGTQSITYDEGYDGLNSVEVTATVESVGSKYAPRYLRFSGYTGNDLDYEIENLDTSNITAMDYMFSGCSNLSSLDISKLNFDNVESMIYAFNNSKFTSIKLPKFINVYNLGYAFKGCSNVKSVTFEDLSKNNPATIVNEMFYGCTNLETVDFGNANINMSSLYRMFYNCTNLKTMDMSHVTSGTIITNLNNAFYQCTSLRRLDIRTLEFYSPSATNMFAGVPSDCEIIVKSVTQKNFILGLRSDFTNVKTVAEL